MWPLKCFLWKHSDYLFFIVTKVLLLLYYLLWTVCEMVHDTVLVLCHKCLAYKRSLHMVFMALHLCFLTPLFSGINVIMVRCIPLVLKRKRRGIGIHVNNLQEWILVYILISLLPLDGIFIFPQTVCSQRNVKRKKKNVKIAKANKYACSHVSLSFTDISGCIINLIWCTNVISQVFEAVCHNLFHGSYWVLNWSVGGKMRKTQSWAAYKKI